MPAGSGVRRLSNVARAAAVDGALDGMQQFRGALDFVKRDRIVAAHQSLGIAPRGV